MSADNFRPVCSSPVKAQRIIQAVSDLQFSLFYLPICQIHCLHTSTPGYMMIISVGSCLKDRLTHPTISLSLCRITRTATHRRCAHRVTRHRFFNRGKLDGWSRRHAEILGVRPGAARRALLNFPVNSTQFPLFHKDKPFLPHA
uniref:Retrovirus-related Pol polyprotein from transposon 17.6 n=1 Tax=Schistocephalus solidus TaxID=70667 RepID=A0A0V0JBZ9_SCHSO